MKNLWRGMLVVMFGLVVMLGNTASADIIGTYVEADGGGGGNSVNAADGDDGNWWTYTNSSTDGYWACRSNSLYQGGDYFQASDPERENGGVPMIKTTITGLTPGAAYAITVVYGGNTGDATWNIDAGLASDSLATFYYGDGVSLNTGIILEGDGIGETVYTMQGPLGTAAASAAGEISVFVARTTEDGGRGVYDGVTYAEVPEPATCSLLLLGALGVGLRRRKK